jgi:hypothetical protein
MQELYYTPPPDEIFEEMKKLAIGIWSTYDDTYGYASKKINRIKHLDNELDNFMYIFAMFDPINQLRLVSQSSKSLFDEIKKRLESKWGYVTNTTLEE